MGIKIVVISDTHLTDLDNIKWPEGDILIHCGDATYRGNIPELSRFNEQMGKVPYDKKYFCCGNHDLLFESMPNLAKETATNYTPLIDEGIIYEGIKIYFYPWTPTFYNWAFMTSEELLADKLAKIPKDIDILVSHGPPREILDINDIGESCGSFALRKFIEERENLKYVLCGHIHESGGLKVHYRGTTIINASLLNDRYKLVRQPIVFEI